MFETNYKNSIPGYTGHLSTKNEQDVALVNREARKHIPGTQISIVKFWFIFRLRRLSYWCQV